MTSINRDNIKACWDQVQPIELREGIASYPRLHKTMVNFASKYDIPLKSVIGAFSALSPNNDYMGNLRSLVTLLIGYQNGHSVDRLTVSTYNACKYRAWRFLHGEDFLEVTKGPKTRSFYLNILNPDDPTPITIDGHMYSIAIGERLTMLEAAWEGFKYEAVANLYRDFAAEVELIPNQLQGVLWFTWKRIHRVLYREQMSLFAPEDHWGMCVDVDVVKPFVREVV